jgi:hypothetical protein
MHCCKIVQDGEFTSSPLRCVLLLQGSSWIAGRLLLNVLIMSTKEGRKKFLSVEDRNRLARCRSDLGLESSQNEQIWSVISLSALRIRGESDAPCYTLRFSVVERFTFCVLAMTKHNDVYRRTERSRSQSTGEVDPSFAEVEVVLWKGKLVKEVCDPCGDPGAFLLSCCSLQIQSVLQCSMSRRILRGNESFCR